MLVKVLLFAFAVFSVIAAGLIAYTGFGVRQSERAYPPVGRFVAVDGLRLHYVDVGAGVPIVLLHGASSNLREFTASLLEPLARHYRVLAFDRPGYGYSERPNDSWSDPARQARLLRDALHRLGVEKPILVGHSWSGALVLSYVLDYPEEVGGGVLLAGVTHPWSGEVYWSYDLARMPVVGTVFSALFVYPVGRLLLTNVAANVFAPNPVAPDHLVKTGADLALRPASFRANADDVAGLSDFLRTQVARYPGISVPLLLISGDADGVVPPGHHSLRLIRAVPAARLAILENTGHALHHVRSRQISETISAFAQRINGGGN